MGGPYAIFWGSICHIFCRNPLTLTDFYAIQTPIVWHILWAYFLQIWGWGWSELFSRAFRSQAFTYGCALSIALQKSRFVVFPNFLAWLPLQKLVGDFFLILGREISREISREFCGMFSDPQNKGSNTSGTNFGAFFVRKFVPRKKSFVPTRFCRLATLTISIAFYLRI